MSERGATPRARSHIGGSRSSQAARPASAGCRLAVPSRSRAYPHAPSRPARLSWCPSQTSRGRAKELRSCGEGWTWNSATLSVLRHTTRSDLKRHRSDAYRLRPCGTELLPCVFGSAWGFSRARRPVAIAGVRAHRAARRQGRRRGANRPGRSRRREVRRAGRNRPGRRSRQVRSRRAKARRRPVRRCRPEPG